MSSNKYYDYLVDKVGEEARVFALDAIYDSGI
jgi:hypothetical protein